MGSKGSVAVGLAIAFAVSGSAAAGSNQGSVPPRQFEIAFLRGSYPRASTVVATPRTGERESVVVQGHGRIYVFAWAKRGTTLYLETDVSRVELQPDGSLATTDDVQTACLSSPDPARDGAQLECTGDNVIVVLPSGRRRGLLGFSGMGDTGKEQPTLSRDGGRVAFSEYFVVDPPPYWLASIGTRSGESRRLTWSKPTKYAAITGIAWSPNGRRLLFSTTRIYSVASGGGGIRQLVSNGGRVTMSPDGKLIAFDRRVGARRQVFVANVDGTRVRQLTHSAMSSWAPHWRPQP